MMRSMYSGVSGMRSHQMMMDVVADNIANVNTNGFKASRAVFQDTLSQVLGEGSAGTATTGGSNPMQVGLGVHVTGVETVDTQGPIQNTGRPLDLAIQGNGMFVVDIAGETSYTRAGALGVDASNHLVDPTGALIQGWTADSAGAIASPKGAPKPLTIPQTKPGETGADAASLRSYAVADDGSVNAVYSDGSSLRVGQIALAQFPNPAGMVRTGDGHLRPSPAAGAVSYGAPSEGGRGSLTAGALEMSNVDLAQEFTNLMIAQRGFQANSRVLTSGDDLLQELVNLKR